MKFTTEEIGKMLASDDWELVRESHKKGFFRNPRKKYMTTQMFDLSDYPQTKPMFVLVDSVGRFVGVDESSGGYPILTIQPFGAKFWTSEEEAINYRVMFKHDFDWVLYEFLGFKLGEKR